jgi:hypothetical protein
MKKKWWTFAGAAALAAVVLIAVPRKPRQDPMETQMRRVAGPEATDCGTLRDSHVNGDEAKVRSCEAEHYLNHTACFSRLDAPTDQRGRVVTAAGQVYDVAPVKDQATGVLYYAWWEGSETRVDHTSQGMRIYSNRLRMYPGTPPAVQ